MSNSSAKEVVEALAKGVNPITGEEIPESSPLNQPSVIRELYALANSANDRVTSAPENQGEPWTKELKSELAKMYSDGISIKGLAAHFGRTSGAISSELKHQGLA